MGTHCVCRLDGRRVVKRQESHYRCKDCGFIENTKQAIIFESNRWMTITDESHFRKTRCPTCKSVNVTLITESYERTETETNHQ